MVILPLFVDKTNALHTYSRRISKTSNALCLYFIHITVAFWQRITLLGRKRAFRPNSLYRDTPLSFSNDLNVKTKIPWFLMALMKAVFCNVRFVQSTLHHRGQVVLTVLIFCPCYLTTIWAS